MVRDAPTFAEIADEAFDRLRGKVVIAHNASFDYKFLCAEFERAGHRYASETLCTVELSRRLYPREASHSLDAILDRFGIELQSRHRALDDAKALLRFLAVVKRDFPELQHG
jgi:DNA polymerase-3 subunit epsilon